MTARFPDGFVFGCSTAAYQIEGAWDADGKGSSIWDQFCRTPGKVANGDTGDVACDHYHRYAEDLELAAGAGMRAYRFSLSWARLFPEGTGRRNEAGFDFYDRIVDACLERGLDPWPCFYHWDLPQALQDRGGWEKRDSVGWYADYAAAAAERLGDRCKRFVLFNEPGVFVSLGYHRGYHAPGVKGRAAFGAAMHHVNLATAEGARRVRAAVPDAEVGTVLALTIFQPASEAPEDARATETADAHNNLAYADPLLLGEYPELVLPTVEPFIQSGDMEALRTRLDFLGVNHYTRMFIQANERGTPAVAEAFSGAPTTEMKWEVWPQGLYEVLVRMRDRYGDLPLYVTENGMAAPDDRRGPDGRIVDHDRIAYLRDYLGAARRAIETGVPLRGYLIWTLLDNFEWAEGYAMKFGLVEVDRATLERRPKLSYDWYAELARTGAIPAGVQEA